MPRALDATRRASGAACQRRLKGGNGVAYRFSDRARSIARTKRAAPSIALQYLVSTRFKNTIRPPQGVLEPAYMAVALPPGSPLKKSLDEVLVEITAGPE